MDGEIPNTVSEEKHSPVPDGTGHSPAPNGTGVMSRSTLLVITLIVFLASAAVVAWSFFGLRTKSPAINTSPQINQEVTNQRTGENKITKLLPVSIRSPSVKGVRVWYTFSGTVTGIRNNGENVEILTDIQEEGLPQFLVTPQTKVTSVASGQKTATTSATSIQANQKVEISIPYALKQKVWDTVREIRILNP